MLDCKQSFLVPMNLKFDEKNVEFTKICCSLKQTQSRYTEVEKLKLRISMFQTLLGQIPQCSMQLALMFSSLEYKRLLLALPNMGYVFEDYSVVFVITSALTFFWHNQYLIASQVIRYLFSYSALKF